MASEQNQDDRFAEEPRPEEAVRTEAELYGLVDLLEDDAAPPLAFVAFTPTGLGGYAERFQRLAHHLGAMELPQRDKARDAVSLEFAWTEEHRAGFPQGADRDRVPALLRYRASLSVLVDLLAQEWSWRVRDHVLELAPPNYTSAPRTQAEAARQKAAIQGAMRAGRIEKMGLPSAREFLADMETPRRTPDGREISILSLVADGSALVADLRRASQDATDDAIAGVVEPYLQLVEGDQRCEHTGLRLADIWRYFRYSWSLEYFSTPGRNLFYLVRDRARWPHPVIGIAALGNSMAQLRARDAWIGWTVEALQQQLDRAPAHDGLAARVMRSLLSALDHAVDQIDATDLATRAELRAPTDALLRRLDDIATQSSQRRVAALRAHESDMAGRPGRRRPRDPAKLLLAPDDGTARTQADKSVVELYRFKRASQLAELLRTRRSLEARRGREEPSKALEALLAYEEGRQAVKLALRCVKREHMGTSMMDVIICGAIPPYNHLLGGKLVCMLLTSPEVRLHYHRRYADRPSEIASVMKGEALQKSAELVFLGTTSLYHVGSSQYNRVRVPAAVAGGTGELRYDRLGHTMGYGSVHYTLRTRNLLEEVSRQRRGAVLITRTFGEGVNPKMRLVREGLGFLGLDHDRFLKHQCRRIVYGVALARNAREFLRNEAPRPDYFIPSTSPEDARRATAAIARAWSLRWLTSRARNVAALESAARVRPEDLRMSSVVSRPSTDAPASDARPQVSLAAPRQPRAAPRTSLSVEFVQRLYNHWSCYADRLSEEQLAAIHVETPLEGFIIDQLSERRDVVLTGNPGDGKTHLILRLLPRLRDVGAEHHLDATAEESYDAIIEQWRAARRRRRPFCLAINEWPLHEMLRGFSDQFEPLREVRAQLERGVVYDDDAAPRGRVVVVDLNHRSLLVPAFVAKLLDTLLSDQFYPECPACPAREVCDVPRARRALRHERVRERLYALLELVAKRGEHVAMRDLHGFVAYLIAAGRTCKQLMKQDEPSPYFSLAFSGKSALFDAVRAAFDPARVTHPLYDEALWEGTLPSAGWPELAAAPVPPAVSPDPMATMAGLKRRFFFEHEEGDRLVRLLPPDERRFYDLLDLAPEDPERVTRDLLRAINRFFDPRDDNDAALRLWNRHHYDARWSHTYAATRSVPLEAFEVLTPRLPVELRPAIAYQPDHVVLSTRSGGQRVAGLRVDLALFRALCDAQRGLPAALRPPEVLRRIELFFDALGRAFRARRDIEDVHIKNLQTGAELRLKVDRKRRRYSL